MPKPGKGGGNDGGSISGNKRDNILTGTTTADLIEGNDGNDTLIGLDGNDTLLGGNDNDWLDGGAGDDSIDGGAGTDIALFNGNRDDYTVTDLGGGLIEISGPEGTDTFTNIELYEFADMTQSAAEVVVPRLANLVAGTLTVYDTSLAPGKGTGAAFHLVSNGVVDAGESVFELLIASAPDEGAVIAVLDTQTAAPIVTGDTDVYQTTIPADVLDPGTYWVAVRADAAGTIEEEDETDNLADWVQITIEEPVTDLRMVSATLGAGTDTDLSDGAGLIEIDYAITNAGNTGSGQYRVVAFLSRDGTVSADDIQIAEYSGLLFDGGSATNQLRAYLPGDTPGGDWQVLTTIEWTGGETEATPGDNTIAQAVSLTPVVSDLRLNAATLGGATDTDLSGGGQLEITYDWENAGAIPQGAFSIKSYLSTDAEISADDMAILGISGGTVAGQVGSSTTSHYFQPDFEAGTYYLISEITWADGTVEASPQDNTIVQQVTFSPALRDLAINDVTLRAETDLVLDEDGGLLSYDVAISNVGEVFSEAPVTAWLSTDGSISADDIRIDGGTVSLAAGESTTVWVDAALDPAVHAGDYTLIVTLAAPDDYAGNSVFRMDLTLEDPAAPPVISGTEAADTLTGTAGDDVIEALGGDDLILATDGFDVTDGGEGFDTVDFSGLSVGVRLVGDYSEPGAIFREDPVTGGREQTFRNVEAIIGTGEADVVSLWNTDLRYLDLGAGDDMAGGSEYDDVILGGAGNDLVAGDMGDDTVTLGEGADIFGVSRYSSGPFPFGSGNDVVTDFDASEDALYFQITSGTTYDPLADTVQTAEGALISYVEGSSILLEGVDMADLTAANFMFEDSINTFG
ncbi:hypothetical protein [Marimonas lutisalis]|uniref:hypothetical protein n=1 Tax=Marimonas lutisalis TaxID=2545756 RepID=UPI0010F9E313|nr:hypothetical protein [Marimonas lutisalis]